MIFAGPALVVAIGFGVLWWFRPRRAAAVVAGLWLLNAGYEGLMAARVLLIWPLLAVASATALVVALRRG